MAALSDLELAERLVTQLNAHQSQGSLASQANDCWPIVQALGYYDLADHLKRMAESVETSTVTDRQGDA